MALKPCRECGAPVSTQAKACPHCGISSPGGIPPPVKKRKSPIGISGIVLIAIGAFFIFSQTSGPAKKEPDRLALDFSKPIYTEKWSVICPQSIFVDVRADHGITAFRDAELSMFGRREKFAKLGCEEWNSGIRVYARRLDPPIDHYIGLSVLPGAIPMLFTHELYLRN